MGSSSSGRRSMALVVFFYSTPLALLVGLCWSQEVTAANNSSVMSGVAYPGRRLRSNDWDYLRVEIPPGFSTLTMTVYSDTDVEGEIMVKSPTTVLPVMCLRSAGLPLPDISERSLNQMASDFISNGTIGASLNLQSAVHCFPFQKTLKLTLTNEQIPYGVWYVGYFNGLGPQRTQSKMIDRGHSHWYTFDLNIEGCSSPSMWGRYCNRTVDIPSCTSSLSPIHSRGALDVTMGEDGARLNSPDSQDFVRLSQFDGQGKDKSPRSRVLVGSESSTVTCNTSKITCIGSREAKLYSLDVTDSAPLFEIMANEVKFSQTTSVNNTKSADGISLMCYVRHNAIPSREMHDSSADLMTSSLITSSPEVGRWYVAVEVVNKTRVNELTKVSDFSGNLCFSFDWQVRECPDGKAGVNCSWKRYVLQRVTRKSSRQLPFDSYYLPEWWDPASRAHFSLQPLLSNSSSYERSADVWTYFLFNIPAVAAGSNLHIRVKSNARLNCEVYLKSGGGFPSLDDWDYCVDRSMSRGNDSMILVADEHNDKTIDFYVVYPKEGTWTLGVKSPSSDNQLEFRSRISISTVKCPRRCSSHGSCRTASDLSGSTIFGYCSCDRSHGGFDCSNELITPNEHVLRSVALIASNAAAILPAFFAFRRKAYAEWLIYTASGFSSAIYHACDVGTWCPLSFSVLQFLDFWLSFMAVGSTFIYLTTLSETTKRFFLTGFSILTAFLAVNGATNSANITAVMSIGAVFLLFGWLMECSPKFRRSRSDTSVFRGCGNCNLRESWKEISRWPRRILMFFLRRFRWYYTLLGFVALIAAATCWKLENRNNYWIWHSLWHITIYTSSFFFLCSAVVKGETRDEEEPVYELPPPDSPREAELTERHC